MKTDGANEISCAVMMVAAFDSNVDVSGTALRTRDESPVVHLGEVGFARIEYPRTYTQSSFLAGMWHTLQSVL